jgi:tetratricopeptide (TPR) repeat protein
MTKSRRREIKQKAISELGRLSEFLDEELEITANMSIAEIDEELREMGVDPNRLPSLSFSRVLSEKNELSPAYAYVLDEPIHDERATDEVKHLILVIRHLSRQQRYEEALGLAEQATRLAPDYWRAWRSYGGLLGLLGNVDEAEAIYRRVQEDFSDDPKAVAAALHGLASMKEVRCKLNPSGDDLREVSRLYEGALELDSSRANTRACLVIHSMQSDQIAKGNELIEDSALCEGFLGALALEVAEREARSYGAKMYKVKQAFSIGFRNLLYGSGPGHAGSTSAGVAY